MIENVGRKITLILALLALSALSLLWRGFRLGLDLEGGTRLAYSLDLEEARDEGLITEEEYQDPTRLWNEIRQILLQRLDPQGVREPVIRLEGNERFVIELPGSAATLRESITLPLGSEIGPEARALELAATQEEAKGFPARGGQIQIDDEVIRYSRRIGTRLEGLDRNYDREGIPAAHEAGSGVRLIALDPWREKIENIGSMAFHIQARPQDLAGTGVDLEEELTRAREWAEEHPDQSLEDYNRQRQADPDLSQAAKRLRFFPIVQRDPEGEVIEAPRPQRLRALIVEEDEDWRFSGADVRRVYSSQDEWGLPAVGFEMKAGAKNRFWRFTEEHEDQPMAIIINDEIVTMPNIKDPLPGGGIITGEFTVEEVNGLVTTLRSGSLPLRPTFEGQETVDATLGASYVRRGFLGIGLGLLTVLVFMMAVYRRLGVFAAVSLVVNLVLLMGALAFLQATLTLPGVAGILLTVGMAVDANILIYERIREEAERGRKPLQSARDGFAHALSTIVDANLTTLITGLILLNFGTGPVRGFATTLSIGIVTSMFSALVVTRLLVHLQLEKGIDRFTMGRLIRQTKVRFMSMTRPALAASGVVVLGGVAFFLSLEDEEKLGIDFLGGMTLSVTLAEAHETDEVRGWIGSIGGVVGESATVRAIRNSAEGDGYTRFRITAKGTDLGIEARPRDQREASGGPDGGAENGQAAENGGGTELGAGDARALEEFRSKIDTALKEHLSRGPVSEPVIEEGTARGLLFLQRKDHPLEDIANALSIAGIDEAEVTAAPEEGDNVVRYEGQVPLTTTPEELEMRLVEDLQTKKDSRGVQIALASPIDNVYAVGAQVVSELRDNAIIAVLLSLFAAVMYIRVRFAEYSFGFAAVAALTHDVLITLGALALADRFIPFIDTEINLPMIAAFLTIIGYSLNDTIVVFDRVRENLPRMKGSLAEIIDRSINQCLGRTVLTSITTLISVALLLAFNLGTGNVIEGFAFALIIGVVVGTYSSIFIASPVLLWLETRRQRNLPPGDASKQGAKVEPSTV